MMPPFPGDPALDFINSLEHIIKLTSAPMRNAILTGAGVTTVHDLHLIDEESLLDACTAVTPVIAKMRLKTLKRWTEKKAGIDKATFNIQDFIAVECCDLQRELARIKRNKGDGEAKSSSMKDKPTPFNGKAEAWDKSKRLL